MKNCKNCGEPIVKRDPTGLAIGLLENFYVHDREEPKPLRKCLDKNSSTERHICFLHCEEDNKKILIAEE